MKRLRILMLLLALPVAAFPDDRTIVLNDVLNIDATVSTDVVPDLAVITLAIVREGPDVAPLTREVNEALTKAFAQARAVPGVIASNGGYSTFPRYDSRGNQNTRTGWQVRAEIVLKSKDFNALGDLVGKLSQTLQIAGSSFAISPEVRATESSALIDRGARAFQDKAMATARAFGYSGYSIREITLGSAGQTGIIRQAFEPAAAMSSRVAVAPMPVESGLVTLSLTINGSVQMRK